MADKLVTKGVKSLTFFCRRQRSTMSQLTAAGVNKCGVIYFKSVRVKEKEPSNDGSLSLARQTKSLGNLDIQGF